VSGSTNIDLPEFGPDRVSLRARWVFPVCGPPLENGIVEVTAGRITAVHDRPDRPTHDLGNAAIIPGLVNAHTHLELSDVAAPLTPAHPFTEWLQAVIAHRRDRTASGASDDRAVAAGLSESVRTGTTTVGDITGRHRPESATESYEGPRAVAFLEILGLAPERRALQLQRAREHLAVDTSAVHGLSPHAPYSVHPKLLHDIIDLAVQHSAPVAMHLAETPGELELLANGTGAFVAFLQKVGVWRDDVIPRCSRPLDYLRELARATRALVIHGNYLNDEEIEFIAAHPQLSAVYCPRTHAFFGHRPHPWRWMHSQCVNVALGTDSRASNPDLSLFAELQFLRQIAPDLDPAELLRMGTFNGALALGMNHETGSLAVGNSADLAVVTLPESSGDDPYSLLFHPDSRIVSTLRALRCARSVAVHPNPQG
jgi:cytosine/adenosine deaminase-related metal-dependent hydrolase